MTKFIYYINDSSKHENKFCMKRIYLKIQAQSGFVYIFQHNVHILN